MVSIDNPIVFIIALHDITPSLFSPVKKSWLIFFAYPLSAKRIGVSNLLLGAQGFPFPVIPKCRPHRMKNE